MDTVKPEVALHRQLEHDVHASFLNRWSPRSFLNKEISEEILLGLFEAAHWAPSGSNEQPWRFIVARSQEGKEQFQQFIVPFNRVWCEAAPVLVLALSYKMTSKGTPNRSHAFDAGTAWGYLALEASRRGLISHAMGGFEPDKARELLHIPDEYELHAVIAIGYQGDKEVLPEALQQREFPSARRPIGAFLFEDHFGNVMK